MTRITLEPLIGSGDGGPYCYVLRVEDVSVWSACRVTSSECRARRWSSCSTADGTAASTRSSWSRFGSACTIMGVRYLPDPAARPQGLRPSWMSSSSPTTTWPPSVASRSPSNTCVPPPPRALFLNSSTSIIVRAARPRILHWRRARDGPGAPGLSGRLCPSRCTHTPTAVAADAIRRVVFASPKQPLTSAIQGAQASSVARPLPGSRALAGGRGGRGAANPASALCRTASTSSQAAGHEDHGHACRPPDRVRHMAHQP